MTSLKAIRNVALGAALLGAAAMTPAHAHAEAPVFIGISVGIAPPPLPVYAQPELPGDGYIWIPGCWAWGDAGYYWVPGYWALPPQEGLLWTPAWWGFEDGAYMWHEGYWGPEVGFYGGINYGFGYGGIGFYGGEWRGHSFFYNSVVVNVGYGRVSNVYVNRDVVFRNTIVNRDHLAFNGPGGIDRQPAPFERQAMNARHFDATPAQAEHQRFAAQDRVQYAAFNNGRPGTIASGAQGSYRATAEQHARTMPITPQDRQEGQHYNARPGGAGDRQNVQSPQNFNDNRNALQQRPQGSPTPQQQQPMTQPQRYNAAPEQQQRYNAAPQQQPQQPQGQRYNAAPQQQAPQQQPPVQQQPQGQQQQRPAANPQQPQQQRPAPTMQQRPGPAPQQKPAPAPKAPPAEHGEEHGHR